MTIEFDRRHAFYLDTEGTPHIFCPYRLDRLWRGEPEATEPQLANQRIRFALLHIERFTSPPRVVLEHYPIIPFDAHGRIDVAAHEQQLQADVDRLESTDYAPNATAASATEWRPDPFTRRHLIAATRPRYASSRSGLPHRDAALATVRGRSPESPTVSPTLPTRPHRRSATHPTFVACVGDRHSPSRSPVPSSEPRPRGRWNVPLPGHTK